MVNYIGNVSLLRFVSCAACNSLYYQILILNLISFSCYPTFVLLLLPLSYNYCAYILLTFCGCRYIATIDGVVNKRHLVAISDGTVIDGVHCTPDAVELLPQQPDKPRPRIRIVVILFSAHLEAFSICIQLEFCFVYDYCIYRYVYYPIFSSARYEICSFNKHMPTYIVTFIHLSTFLCSRNTKAKISTYSLAREFHIFTHKKMEFYMFVTS